VYVRRRGFAATCTSSVIATAISPRASIGRRPVSPSTVIAGGETVSSILAQRGLLGDLLLPFGFLGRSSDPDLLVAQRLRRNPRVRKGHRFIRNSTLAHLIKMFHHEHSMAATACGPVCNAWPNVLSFKPPVKADQLTEKALEIERKDQHASAAACYRAALDQAEVALGTDHPYLAWILVRYWLALRHAGQHAKARRIKPRTDAMWAKYGQGHLSD